ncbi:MAG: 2-isopropylmalate synthase [Pseudomonadales bacterium]
MSAFDHSKYTVFPPVSMPARRWPDRVIDHAPRWCSVDLRDGNQALMEPMSVEQKLRLFDQLLVCGFKEIEVGFPAASQPDFDFVRKLIEEQRIPDDVTIQVLVQTREHLIERTFEALKGAKKAIVHIYNSTSTVQREQVFGLDRESIKKIAVDGATVTRHFALQYPDTEWMFQYSPESFTETELDFAVEVCNAVIDVWQPSPAAPVIINLPATVEVSTPNVYADQIEWMCDNIRSRDSVIISLHTHNDRGCAVAAAELGVMAGADRVEGTLFGNGERTGNMDIITMAMNLYSRGVDPELDFSRADEMIQTYKSCTNLPVHPRHPWMGELVFTAFSGSHQDAINKCLAKYEPGEKWRAAYLPIDPADLGRSYEEVIRINSQSGKGGVSYVLRRDYGLELPRWMQIEFSSVVQKAAEVSASEVGPEVIYQLFRQTYLEAEQPWQMSGYELSRHDGQDTLSAELRNDNASVTAIGKGAGVVEAFIDALSGQVGQPIVLLEYSEHALSQSAGAEAMAYIQLSVAGLRFGGAALSNDIVAASLKAILAAYNRASAAGLQQVA